MLFADRVHAGRVLADRLAPLAGDDAVVLGLPRGGVVVAAEVAHALGAPLDVVLVRKLGAPLQGELAMGALGEDGVVVVNDEVVDAAGVTPEQFAAVQAREEAELARQAARYRDGRARVPVAGRTAVVVDDGIATGSTARAACLVVRALGAARVVLAVPVAPPGWEARLGGAADEYVAVETPRRFSAVGAFYDEFGPTEDDEVVACLARRPS